MAVNGKTLMIGLPKTGKTTFLGALWHVVNHREVPGALQLVKLDTDSEYIDVICQDWMGGRVVERTLLGTEQYVSMKLAGVRDTGVIELVFPDLSGEIFDQQWVEGVWGRDFDEMIRGTTGLILFIHPQRVNCGEVLGPEMEALVAEASSGDMEQVDGGEAAEPEQFEPEKSPTQVKLIELLQFMVGREYLDHLGRLAVVISAWDLVESWRLTPQQWVEKHLPMLAQFLRANGERLATRFYGISAQGGELSDQATKLRLVQMNKSSDRIIVNDGRDCSHDITKPIKWLMED